MSRWNRKFLLTPLNHNSPKELQMEQTPNNGWEAMGKLTMWVLPQLQGNQLSVYLAIARRTIGYLQYTSELTSYAQLADITGISTRTIERIVPDLIQSGYIIKVATNQVANVGKLPYKYQLNMQLPNFPHLGKLRSSSEDPITKSVKKKALTEAQKLDIKAKLRKELKD